MASAKRAFASSLRPSCTSEAGARVRFRGEGREGSGDFADARGGEEGGGFPDAAVGGAGSGEGRCAEGGGGDEFEGLACAFEGVEELGVLESGDGEEARGADGV